METGEEAEPKKEAERHHGDARDQGQDGLSAGVLGGLIHRVLEKNLACHRAHLGEQNQEERQAGHSFSSARTSGRATRTAPASTSRMPSQRRPLMCSPRNSQLLNGTSAWMEPVRLNAIFNAMKRSARSHDSKLTTSARMPSQVQPECRPSNPSHESPTAASAPRLRNNCA